MFHEVVELVRAVAWPITTIAIVFVIRRELVHFLSMLSDSLTRAANISIGTKGLNIQLSKDITAVNSRVTAVLATQDQIKGSVLPRARKSSHAKGQDVNVEASHKIPPALLALASEYLGISIADYRERLHRKNLMAVQMGAMVVELLVDRDALMESRDEGLYLALSASVVAQPEEGDLSRLLRIVGFGVKRLHVRYRIVLALTVMINSNLIGERDREAIRIAFESMRRGADEPLNKFIGEAENLLESVISGEITSTG